jgi:hypothetical protein
MTELIIRLLVSIIAFALFSFLFITSIPGIKKHSNISLVSLNILFRIGVYASILSFIINLIYIIEKI